VRFVVDGRRVDRVDRTLAVQRTIEAVRSRGDETTLGPFGRRGAVVEPVR
jgi:hypothetical protein